jgi:hypothetical protein
MAIEKNYGYGKNVKDWIIRSEASKCMEERSETKWLWVGYVISSLRYSPAFCESKRNHRSMVMK